MTRSTTTMSVSRKNNKIYVCSNIDNEISGIVLFSKQQQQQHQQLQQMPAGILAT